MAIGSVGVGARVYGRPCGAVVLPSPPTTDKDKDHGNHSNHEDETCDGNADCECAGRQAELVRVIEFLPLDLSEVGGGVLVVWFGQLERERKGLGIRRIWVDLESRGDFIRSKKLF